MCTLKQSPFICLVWPLLARAPAVFFLFLTLLLLCPFLFQEAEVNRLRNVVAAQQGMALNSLLHTGFTMPALNWSWHLPNNMTPHSAASAASYGGGHPGGGGGGGYGGMPGAMRHGGYGAHGRGDSMSDDGTAQWRLPVGRGHGGRPQARSWPNHILLATLV